MPNCSATQKNDLVANRKHYALVWGAPALLLLLSWSMTMPLWAKGFIWATALVWMGRACLWNASRCGRWHCFFTGPFFLLSAFAALSIGLEWPVTGRMNFNALGLILLLATPVLHILPDVLGGTYRRLG